MVASNHKQCFYPCHFLLHIFLIFSFFFFLPPKVLSETVDVSLSWDENTKSELVGYRLFHRLDGQNYDFNTPIWHGTSTNCVISNLAANTAHYFIVRAYGKSGIESSNSNEVVYRGLMISNFPDRSGAEALSSQSVSGFIYVFTHPDDHIESVRFYLDDVLMRGSPYTVEDTARYDLEGTAKDGSANPFDTRSLANGLHDITAQIVFTDGTMQILSGPFIVSNTSLAILERLAITGSRSINESTTESYTAIATYSDGTTKNVTAGATWTEDSAYASTTNQGLLTASSVTSNQSVLVTATYAKNGVSRSAQKMVTITNTVPVLSGLSISGSSSVIENNSNHYSAIATYSDGTTKNVTAGATWTDDSVHASMNNGILSTVEVMEDEIITITVSFTHQNITKKSQKTVTIINVPLSNMVPTRPIVIAPYNGQVNCNLTFEVTTQPFVDPDGDSHTKTRWEVSSDSHFSNLVLDMTSSERLTSMIIPHTLLKENTAYYLRVQFQDYYLATSEWSETVLFYTASDIRDTNDNGIPDDQEVGTGVDLDENGIDDINEPDKIKSVKLEEGYTAIGVYKDSNSVRHIDAVELIDPKTLPDTLNTPPSLPDTLFSYRVSVTSPGAEAFVTIYYSQPIPDGAKFFKYDTMNGWSDYSDYTTFNGDGRSFTIKVKDGSYGDCDGVANGIILDPGGLLDGGGFFDDEAAGSERDWYNFSCFIVSSTKNTENIQPRAKNGASWKSVMLGIIFLEPVFENSFRKSGPLAVFLFVSGLLSCFILLERGLNRKKHFEMRKH